MTVRELTRDQLAELKEAYFWDPETPGFDSDYAFPWEIPDEDIFSYYAGISFVPDDFDSFVESIPCHIPF